MCEGVLAFLMIFTKYISKEFFSVQILIFTIVFIIGANASILILYFSHAGQPYKSSQHYKHVLHVAGVGTYWTLAILAKLILGQVMSLDLVPLSSGDES